MASEHDILARLPEAPAPSPDARQAAIASAVERFEKKNRAYPQGSGLDRRLTQQTAPFTPPSRRSPAMPRARHLIAASLVVLMTGSAAWFYVGETQHPAVIPGVSKQQTLSYDQAIATRLRQDPNSGLMSSYALPPVPAPQKDARWLAPTAGVELLVAPPGVRVVESGAPAEPVGRDRFTGAPENAFKVVREAPVSTFSIDVDTASYSFVRASLNRNVLPQPNSVRVEELINYFPYAYPAPTSASEPFRTTVAVFPSPWSEGRKIVQIGDQGLCGAGGHPPARQPGVPDRHLRLHECAEPAAAGQAIAGDAAHPARTG